MSIPEPQQVFAISVFFSITLVHVLLFVSYVDSIVMTLLVMMVSSYVVYTYLVNEGWWYSLVERVRTMTRRKRVGLDVLEGPNGMIPIDFEASIILLCLYTARVCNPIRFYIDESSSVWWMLLIFCLSHIPSILSLSVPFILIQAHIGKHVRIPIYLTIPIGSLLIMSLIFSVGDGIDLNGLGFHFHRVFLSVIALHFAGVMYRRTRVNDEPCIISWRTDSLVIAAAVSCAPRYFLPVTWAIIFFLLRAIFLEPKVWCVNISLNGSGRT